CYPSTALLALVVFYLPGYLAVTRFPYLWKALLMNINGFYTVFSSCSLSAGGPDDVNVGNASPP
ncbi:hypothetical protein K435DRAFT_785451, partial [Dendrothele bispora CBS 962.96]